MTLTDIPCACGCGLLTQRYGRKQSRYVAGHYRPTGAAAPAWRGGRAKQSSGYVLLSAPEHPRASKGYVYEHVLVVERALGHCLPDRAVVHHVDRNKQNNANTNLVACQHQAYHALLHQRQRAFDACGNASAVRCMYCGGYEQQDEMYKYTRRNGRVVGCHHRCSREYDASISGATLDPVTGRAMPRTHCRRRGHLLTDENTYRRPDGSRLCRECVRAQESRS